MNNNALEVIATWSINYGLNNILHEAITEGLSGVRLILKGQHKELPAAIDQFCHAVKKINPNFKIMIDLPGSKPRFGNFDSPLIVNKGDLITFSFNVAHTTDNAYPTEYLGLYSSEIKIGDRLLTNDGTTTFIVNDLLDDCIIVRLLDQCATIVSNRSINLPDSKVNFKALSPVDVNAISQLTGLNFDMIAISMVNTDSDIIESREIMFSLGFQSELIAKIETPKALLNLEKIVEKSDSLMIARGDLTTIYGGSNLFYAQKMIIDAGKKYNKSIIGATGLFASLSESEEPTISEFCDVGYLLASGISRFLLSDAVSLNQPARACRWFKKQFDSFK